MVDIAEKTPRDLPKTIFNPATCSKRGWCKVATSKDRALQPHDLYYELHGSTSPQAIRLLFIMGLNNSSFAWSKQVDYFGDTSKTSPKEYSVLVFDNRGVGNSDTPKGLYKTSEMAVDAKELLDYTGWLESDDPTKIRKLNVIGVSMGGMIALELASLIPNHINALILTSTKAGNKFDLPQLKAIHMVARLSTGTVWSVEHAISLIVDTLFPSSYLDTVDLEAKGDEAGLTRRKTAQNDFVRRYHMNRRQTVGGRVGQLAAVIKHNVSEKRLLEISKTIPKIAIITGDCDSLVNPQRSQELHEMMPGSILKVVKEAGHALPNQIYKEYNEWLQEMVE